ncbi:hypothetical protein JKA62_14985 [Pseudomonas sp. B7]|nr:MULTISPECIES: hypothetical protein [Pseudomonas]MBX8621202.1 hypothetical protein [Pseudomonas glycinae]MBL0796384.1 hypothetical protein [Pseudomonas sp. B7]MBY9026295.1 hypothetical protein [Pseudomonas fluorescens]MBY9030140.1 hypothetical protein [Pseudomonas fluorescens]MBY9038113.1 hypothetical protein [Pseudomonas fluorescens]
MQTLVCFRVAILTAVRNSLRWHHFLALAIPDVLLGHHNGGMSKLIFGLHDIATRFRLVSASLGAQVTHLELDLFNSSGIAGHIKAPP